jgi:hypothetical protein
MPIKAYQLVRYFNSARTYVEIIIKIKQIIISNIPLSPRCSLKSHLQIEIVVKGKEVVVSSSNIID